MKETGLRNGAHGADKFGLKDLAAVHWNLPDTILVEHAIANREGELVQGGAFCAETGVHTGRSPKDKFVVADAPDRKIRLVGQERPAHAGAVRASVRRFHRARQRQDAFRAGPLWRRRPEIPHQGARLHRACLALDVHPRAADPARSALSSPTTFRISPFCACRRSRPTRSATACAARPSSRVDFTRRIILIGGSYYAGEMKKSVFTTLNYYLPAESVMPMHCSANVGPDGRRRAVLRPVGHRQDDAVGRSQPHADRRRRARLGPAGRVQLRGRLLRQVHQALGRGGAGDLRHHAPLRHGAGKRRVRSRTRASAISTTNSKTENTRCGLSARVHPERVAHRPCRPCRRTSLC